MKRTNLVYQRWVKKNEDSRAVTNTMSQKPCSKLLRRQSNREIRSDSRVMVYVNSKQASCSSGIQISLVLRSERNFSVGVQKEIVEC